MAFPIGEKSVELLQAEAKFWNYEFNFLYMASLKCATKLGIPDIIHKHGKPMTLQQLGDALPINKTKIHGVHRLMRVLVHSRFFIEEKVSEDDTNMGYWLTPASRLLIKDQALSMIPFVEASFDPTYLKPWYHMSEWFQNDDLSAFETAHGSSLWDYACHDPKLNQAFNEDMSKDTEFLSSIIIRECKNVFDKMNSMVDVGGNTGFMAKAIVDAFPHLHCSVFDLPHVIEGLEGSYKNLTYIKGNMFESIPQADAIMLKWILHDWSDEECVKILKKCKEAIPRKENGGKVIIIDMIVGNNKEDHQHTETQLFNDLAMMLYLNGKERTEKEWEKLFFDAGYSGYKIAYELGLRSLIEVYP
ncbi:trans-resveratrol di-O-methyltransferase-like [Olea europaea var. sylvestris]|uniref:Trans-resveratrol di-O-methyltransferase-like n=1 Tax=Olea europaea subsp. europaea TaxID=158383 RepID=A0A8S0UHB1_OLEEU|nr:trans-resveratrol di-O-methyltransferase-like [Olea europaea var. sylvestris]CAA3017199.1 trans-resveratrol di-O-methyltransferase-like [Olea europaea subsp. europaea]